jgi:hypothetical protein
MKTAWLLGFSVGSPAGINGGRERSMLFVAF